jgi:WD40 repeat protein
MTTSPFKFLDSYTREDRDIFFGREREIEELYHRVFESKIMLVYGVSGTGKSSLINCGLANKFQDTDWLPINVRRAGDILQSMAFAIQQAAITPVESENLNPKFFKKAVTSLYLDHYKPVFFIFDQIEELFIFGNRQEQKEFFQLVKALLESELSCRFIFVLRKEYLADVSEFERLIPTLMANRVNIERMTLSNASQAIEGPCKVSNIQLEEGFSEALLEKLSPGSTEVELTYLQVFLDKLYHMAAKDNAGGTLNFSKSLLEKTGNVSDLLGSFLDEQISLLDDPDTSLAVLKSFVSVKGTKRQMSSEEIQDYAQTLGKPIEGNALQELIQTFINLRILRDKDQNNRYELRHDALAEKIYEKITMVEKELLEIRQLIENAYHNWQKRGVLISADDLNYIAPFESRLYLSKELEVLVEKSKYALVRAKKRIRNISIAAGLLIFLVLGGFTIWALKERQKSNQNYLKAKANNYNYLSKEILETNPTIALRLAEYAMSIDSENMDIIKNLNRIYYDNNFYKIICKSDKVFNSVAFSPDGKSILTGSEDKTARLWDLEGKLLQVFKGHEDIVNSACFSPDGKSILTGSEDKTARLWNLEGKILRVFKGHEDVISSVAFSLDGKSILTGSGDKTARLWDLEGKLLQVFKGHEEYVFSVAFSPDGKSILTGSSDNTARLWDLEGKLLQVFKGHEDIVTSVAFSPHGKSILTGSSDKTARLWDLEGKLLQVFKGHEDFVFVAFSPDGTSILTGSGDKTARLWDLEGKLLQVFEGHEHFIWSVAFSPDGKSIVTGSWDKTTRLWDLDGKILQVFKGHEHCVYSVAFSPDGKSILTGSRDKTARLWNLEGKLLQVFKGHEDWITSVAFSPDGKSIVTGSDDKTARLWDLEGKLLQVYKGHEAAISSVTFSPDGKSLLTGSGDKTARLWDLEGKLLQIFKGHEDWINSVAFSPDGKSILTGSVDNTARLWDLEGKLLQIFKGHEDGINSLAFSPDGKNILTGSWDKTARLWDLEGKLVQVFKGHEHFVYSVAFSPDGKNILTGSWDNTARLWDLNGKLLQIFKGHEDFVYSVAFSPDGKSILTGSVDKTARLWVIKMKYPAFAMENSYEKLGISDQLRYKILEFKDVINSFDLNTLLESAGYYSNEVSLTDTEKKDCLNKAINLYDKLLGYNRDVKYSLGLSDACIALYNLNPNEKSLEEKIICLHDELNSNPDSTSQLAVFNYYLEKCTDLDSTDFKFTFHKRLLSIGEEIINSSTKNGLEIINYSSSLSDLSLNLIIKKEFKFALQAILLSIKANDKLEIAYTNLPLAYLFNNQYSEAEKVYNTWKDKPWTTDDSFKTFREAFLADIADLESKGITHPDFEKVKKLLKGE